LQQALEALTDSKHGRNKERWRRAGRDHAFDLIRHRVIIETQAEILLKVLQQGTVSTNMYLRRLHNFCLDMNWLPWPIIPKRQWPEIKFKEKRAITWSECQKIVAGESNAELRDYYQLLWHLGGSQTDMASLRAEDIDWTDQTISYARMKTGSQAIIRFGDAVVQILRRRPATGYLFPQIVRWKESDRAKAFMRRCRLVQISGISLHSFRYAWAERAKTCGFPERFAQEALGHGSKAVARAYAKKAKVLVPSLEQYEREYEQKVVPLGKATEPAAATVEINQQPVAEAVSVFCRFIHHHVHRNRSCFRRSVDRRITTTTIIARTESGPSWAYSSLSSGSSLPVLRCLAAFSLCQCL
jgi:integrase